MIATRFAPFDAPERLNDDGTVTFRMVPSNWHVRNMSPDTYSLFTGDSWEESEIEYHREQTGRDLTWDDFTWEHDHAAIVRELSETLADWLTERLAELGLPATLKVVDSWSPAFYNFTSDGFEVEITCDPAQLRALTEGFDVDEWAREHYSSYDGFISFVTGRMSDPSWHADYDAEFRVESLLAQEGDDGDWRYRLWEDEWEIYANNTRVALIEPEYMESGYTLPELEAWAASLTPAQDETLPGVVAPGD